MDNEDEYHFGNPEADKRLNKAVASYRDGHPVVVLDEAESVLHGEDVLQGIAALEMPMEAFVIHGMSREYFESTDWPEILEAARRVFFLKKDPNAA